MTKDLQEKAIDIKGKQYVQVKDRVLYFNDEYENGCIITQLESEPSSKMVVVKAKVTPDMAKPERYFTGYSQATWGDGMVNTTAALENAETSAVGRALAMMGIGVIDSVASVDEMNKATTNRVTTQVTGGTVTQPVSTEQAFVCPEHGVEYTKYDKNGKVWYSHRLEDGSYCNKK